jgi:hypothetical protein
MYDAHMRMLVSLGFVASLIVSGCGGGTTANSPDANTGDSLEQTNSRLTAAIQYNLSILESIEGTSVIDNSNYSSTDFEVKLTVLSQYQGTLFTWEISCKYELTTENYTRISYILTNESGSTVQTGETYCPESN